MVKSMVCGLVLGSVMTILGALFIGPTVIVQSDYGGNHGRYDLRIDEQNGVTRYSIVDTQTGVATITTGEGSTTVVRAEPAPAAE
jgi:hypothetical protein